MRTCCATCGRDLSPDELRCERCHPLPRPKLSELGRVAIDAARMGGVNERTMLAAVAARKEPS
jgi:hypothetical protein